MRLAYAGTPEFARVALDALLAAGHEVVLVLTQPDRPAGRGLKLQPSPVKQLALARSLALAQPRSLRLDGKYPDDAAAARAALAAAAPEVLVVAAYGLILPGWVLELPRHGALNIHGSLLPRWRGAAPIQRAIEAGDARTGITIMQMDAGLDTGAMLLAEATAIGADDTAATLHDRLAAIGARLIVAALDDLAQARLAPVAQGAQGVTYAHKIDKAEGAIDWAAPAAVIERRLRAFDPFPGCSAEIGGQTVKVWRGRVVEGAAGLPGQRLERGEGRLVIACGEGALELLELQLPGGRRIAAREFLQRHPGASA
ncbi:MAG: methionyl-tRNA formyltransferase [Burkholderiales bacterium]|nr:methionyl-tRNA formyltransferase [Burkholderiales bacterium]